MRWHTVWIRQTRSWQLGQSSSACHHSKKDRHSRKNKQTKKLRQNKKNKKFKQKLSLHAQGTLRTFEGSSEERARSRTTLSFGLRGPPLSFRTALLALAPTTSGSVCGLQTAGHGLSGSCLRGLPGGGGWRCSHSLPGHHGSVQHWRWRWSWRHWQGSAWTGKPGLEERAPSWTKSSVGNPTARFERSCRPVLAGCGSPTGHPRETRGWRGLPPPLGWLSRAQLPPGSPRGYVGDVLHAGRLHSGWGWGTQGRTRAESPLVLAHWCFPCQRRPSAKNRVGANPSERTSAICQYFKQVKWKKKGRSKMWEYSSKLVLSFG